MNILPRHKRLSSDVSGGGEYSYVLPRLPADAPPIVVDVGAYGRERSNSWNLLHDHGWRGLLIEPRPGACARIAEQFRGLDTAVEQTAVSDFESEAETLHRFPIIGWSSLNRDNAVIRGKPPGWRIDPIQVPVTTLPKLLAKHGVPKRFGFLTIDAEGHDPRILRPTLEAGWRPDIIAIETAAPFVEQYGYELLYSKPCQHIWRFAERAKRMLTPP